MSINMATVSGNLGRDSELRATQGGTKVLNFSVAINERVKDGDGWKNRPSWIDCVLFGNRAEALAQHLTRGTKVSVQGRLRQSTWEGQDGQKRSRVELIVDEVEFLSRAEQPRQAAQPDLYDDIPFD